ncbi:MAG: tRNA (N6-threonylcarbamoyladenosine(37)-N6)-methyltransferase TrmO [Mariprofundaceae bacterium]
MTGKKAAKSYTDDFITDPSTIQSIEMCPIGIVRSPYKERFAAPRQPCLGDSEDASIELNNGCNFDQALTDLEGFSHIWIIYWMHLNKGWNPTVTPPRGPKIRRGLFATRAPHRPNSIGISVVQLQKIEGRTLHIQTLDMLDGTPVLDIKPYLPYADAHPDASHGWLEEAGLIPS